MKKQPTESKMTVRGIEIAVIRQGNENYISLTDIAKSKNPEHPDDLIRNWLRNRNTLELLGIWEQLHNAGFNPVEFDGIKKQAGLNSYTLTPKQWIEKTAVFPLPGTSTEPSRRSTIDFTPMRFKPISFR